MDLFTQNNLGRLAVHLETESVVVVKNTYWYKGILKYKVLVPMEDDHKKGKEVYCDATYSESEIQLLDCWIKNTLKNKII